MYTIALFSALALLFSALPTFGFPLTHIHMRAGTSITVTSNQLEAIMPSSKSCDKSAQYGTECVTATQAAPWISDSFANYGITTLGEAAGIIATIAQESGDCKYARHHFGPIQAGQGTRNMQMPNYNLKYAQSIPAIQSQVAAANGDIGKILEILLSYGDYDFGSAAWFLTTQCANVRSQLASGSESGWEAYVTCIGADKNDGRLNYWHSATRALGVKSL